MLAVMFLACSPSQKSGRMQLQPPIMKQIHYYGCSITHAPVLYTVVHSSTALQVLHKLMWFIAEFILSYDHFSSNCIVEVIQKSISTLQLQMPGQYNSISLKDKVRYMLDRRSRWHCVHACPVSVTLAPAACMERDNCTVPLKWSSTTQALKGGRL